MDCELKDYILECLEFSRDNAEELGKLSDRLMTRTNKSKMQYHVDSINISDLIEIVKLM